MSSDKLDGFVVLKKVDLNLSLIYLRSNVARVQCQVTDRVRFHVTDRVQCHVTDKVQCHVTDRVQENVMSGLKKCKVDRVWQAGQSADESVCHQRGEVQCVSAREE